MRRLALWPDHRLSLLIAACHAMLAAIVAIDGTLEWYFWGLLLGVFFWIRVAVRELRTARHAGSTLGDRSDRWSAGAE